MKAILCLLVLIISAAVGSETDDNLKVAQALLLQDKFAAESELQATRALIESERRKLLQRISAYRLELHSLRQATHEIQTELIEAEKERSQYQQQSKDAQQSFKTIRRVLATEVSAHVSLTHSAGDLIEAWPHITSSSQERIAAIHKLSHQGESLVIARDGKETSVPVWHWGDVQRIAMGSTANERGLLVRLTDGNWMIKGPNIPHFDPAMPPIDVTGRLHDYTIQDNSPLGLFKRAGPFAWPILAVAVLGLIIIIDRIIMMWRWRSPKDAADRVLSDLSKENKEHVTQRLSKRRDPRSTVLRMAVQGDNLGLEERQQQAGAALVEAESRLQRGLRLLAVLAATAPLLGLLGTVTGMISAFQALNLSQDGAQAEQLSAGIGEALLTTEFGLIAAVPLLLAHAVFARDAQRRRAHCESAAMQVLARMNNDSETPA